MANILVVDDDPMVVEMLDRLLSDAGHNVTCATDGWEAMKRFRPDDHELVVTDVCMPQVDGVDMLRVLRREAPHVPVLVVSGNAWIDKGQIHAPVAQMVAEMGAARMLSKPFSRQELLDAVSNSLNGRASSG